MSTNQAQPWSNELAQASAWWKKQLASSSKAKLASETIASFENALNSLLSERLQGHWFLENPIRGQGLRSISLHRHARPDPVLLKAAAAAKIRNLFDFFSDDVNDITMFIDPCEVAVQTIYTFCKTPQETIVWTSPSKLNLRKPAMQPSATVRVKAKNEVTSSASNSPSSSPQSSPLRRGSHEREDSSPRERPVTTLKASAREYISPSQSPERQPSPPPHHYASSVPYYVPNIPHFYPHYAPQFASSFDHQLSDFVRS